MSYAVRRPVDPSRSSGQASADTPTTATVLDYACLFTHDLRRKQKRWQDGKLKFHTFNKRIMVYDDRGNFVGDSHWRSSDVLDEGEELQLDRGSAIVQISDCTGSREQDLTDLLDKRAKEVEQRRATAAAKTTPVQQTPVRRREGQPQPHFQLKHRPLSAIVPSPGPIGRAAIPDRSPFETRRAEAGGEQQPPAAKKRRLSTSPPSKKGFAQSLFGARLTLSSCPAPTPPPRVRASKEKLDARIEGPTVSQDIAEKEDDDVVMLDGPPLGARDTTAKSAQPRTESAKVIPVVASRDTSWKPPRAKAGADIEKRNLSRHPQRDESPGLHVLESAQPAAGAGEKAREKADNRAMAAQSLANGSRQAVSRKLISRDVEQTADQCSAQKSPENVPLPKSQGPKAEPRTELRIKSRQKRGLLMMSETRPQPRDALARRRPERST
ncbi:uncharacterized protein HRG_09956 [Hirsutella rhossiliensis]|uniref:5'-3' DNA helicase ZGRF1-like N-terminal domain-containing protein n=1 Tax=Hirsutella rhossiliensis TaxID=111463 RepID=A0A9P8SFD6_9HYPO|nr:uncharacterized protein HRG_09956 [Hirsutella rhossiliensis]KAH0958911.1 hypothetical protein HRG_09956 [Hirsutella rhossiliensis]